MLLFHRLDAVTFAAVRSGYSLRVARRIGRDRFPFFPSIPNAVGHDGVLHH